MGAAESGRTAVPDVKFEHCLLYGEPGSVEITKPAVEILKLAERENADMIVLGTHGRTGLSHLLMGSVAETVFCESPHPVIAVKLSNKSGSDGNLDTRSIEALDQLFLMQRFSLAMYLRESHEWTHPGDEPAVNALHKIANYNDSCAKRIAKLLADAVGRVPHGQFPMEFTEHNEIALDYLIPELIRQEQLMLDQTQACLAKLGPEPALQGLIDSILKTGMSHVELLTAVERTLSEAQKSK